MKNDLEGFPEEIINAMLDEQERQGFKRDIEVLKKIRRSGGSLRGFIWNSSKEDYRFWDKVINGKNFDVFFGKYQKDEAIVKHDTYTISRDITERERDELVKQLQAMEFKKQYTTEEVIILLQQFNDYRRYDNGITSMLNPTVIGEVIDEAIKQLKQIK